MSFSPRIGLTRLRTAAAWTSIILLLGLPAPQGATAQADPAACPQWRCTADHSGEAPSGISSTNVSELAEAWRFRTHDRVYGAPSVESGVVFVPSEDKHVYAVDAATGLQKWAFGTDGAVWTTPAVADGLVFFGSADDHVYAVNAGSGVVVWKVQLGGDVAASPTVADGVVHVSSNDGHLYALDAATGGQRWRFEAGVPPAPADPPGEGEPLPDHRLASSPAVDADTVYVGGNDHMLYAVDRATGALRWSFEADGWIWGGGPVVSGGRVYFTSNGDSGGNLYALDAATGEEAWVSADLNGFGTPVVAGDTILATGTGEVRAVNGADGSTLWSYDPGGYVFVSPTVAGDVAFIVTSGLTRPGIAGPANDGDGMLVALDLATGLPAAEIALPVVALAYSSPVVAGDQVFFGTGAHVLHAVSIQGGGLGEVLADPGDSLLPHANRDVLANSIDPASASVLRLPGDGVSKTIGSDDPRGLNADYYHFQGITQDDPSGVPDGRVIMLDVRGPGALTDMYMYFSLAPTAISPLPPDFTPPTDFGAISPNLAMYIDNSPEPVFDMNGFEFYSGGAGFPFQFPLVGEHSAAFSSHVPVPFTERLLIVRDAAATDSGFWYDFYYTQFPDAAGVEPFDPVRDADEYQALLDRWTVDAPVPDLVAAAAADSVALEPGQSVTLLDQSGAGQVSLVNLLYVNETPPVETTGSSDPENDSRAAEPLKGVRIQARWDDREELNIDAPIGDFFGTGFGQAQDYDTLMGGMATSADAPPQQWPHLTELSTVGEGGGVKMYSRWPMPFANHAEITLTNTLETTTVDVAYEVVVDEADVALRDGGLWRDDVEVGYFHALEFLNSSAPTPDSPHPDVLHNDRMVELHGRGNYVGHVFNMRTHNFGSGGPNIPSYMEGDCMFFIDQAPDYKPDMTSTGHEECHDTGAYFQGDEHNATAGTTNREVAGDTIFVNTQDEVSIFRQWAGDAIGFQDYFLASIEHGAENSFGSAEQAGVAYYYLEANPAAPIPAPPIPDPEDELSITRVGGADRVETAAEIAATYYEPRDDGTVVVATAEQFPDALAGGPAAHLLGAPIMLTMRDHLPDVTRQQIQRLSPAQIVVLGGREAVSDAVLAELNDLAPTERVAGPDRFATAAAVSQRFFQSRAPATAYITTGETFPDTLSGGPAAGLDQAPMLLVQRDAIPGSTLAALDALDLERIVLLGGQAAVSAGVEAQLSEYGDTVVRVAGDDRYGTSAALVAAEWPAQTSTVFVATGQDFPDGLTGGPAAAALGAPIVLVDDGVPPAVEAQLVRLDPQSVVILGGTAAVSAEVATKLAALLE